MRYARLMLLPSVLVATVMCGGCVDERSTMQAVPDRGYHTPDPGPATMSMDTSPSAPAPPAANEKVIQVGDNEKLYQIAEVSGVSIDSLIRRNDLSRLPSSGDRLIIPVR